MLSRRLLRLRESCLPFFHLPARSLFLNGPRPKLQFDRGNQRDQLPVIKRTGGGSIRVFPNGLKDVARNNLGGVIRVGKRHRDLPDPNSVHIDAFFDGGAIAFNKPLERLGDFRPMWASSVALIGVFLTHCQAVSNISN